ncbi:uncharacterized protein LOC106462380 isoform X2 [Limulus polyphemus]|uniref:Uncharacterized protein LOC106462380 isoform X2 n=1 Tax=Limulus polyphemus TaxID=6850 RepID=A0ABM1SNY5_LIMPO|nr:uncharacterized protein LOC106462380 isoform X2 [Limulus polyphemus]
MSCMFTNNNLVVSSEIQMEAFLKIAKSYLGHLNQFNGVHAVLDSKSCDLTSATATIVTAFFLNRIKPETCRVVLPVLNALRKDLRLRKEVTFFLEETGISVDLLICKDEIDLEKLGNEGKLFLTLVDHNILSADQQFLENSVVQVIDHHTLQATDRGNRCDTTIGMVGSCCTLVAENLLNTSPDLDPQIAMLLYGAILLDTVCLSEETGRVTPKDVQIVAKLETFLEGVTRTEIFEALWKKKFDLTGLSVEEIFRIDLEVVEGDNCRIAVVSVPGLLENLQEELKMTTVLEEFCTRNSYNGIVIMTIHIDGNTHKIQRQIAVFASTLALRQQLVATLQSAQEPDLQLKPIHVGVPILLSFSQKNTTASMKTVLHLMKSLIQDLSASSHLRQGKPPNSQDSSAQNSCPYTPQNSFVDDTFHLHNTIVKQPTLLPNFNNKDMVEKVKKKRGRLMEFDQKLEVSEMKAFPLAPENSFVECSFDSNEPWKESSVSSGELLAKMQDKEATLPNVQQFNSEFQLNNGNDSVNKVENGNRVLSELLTVGDKIEDAPDSGCADISSGEVSFEVSKSPGSLEDIYKVSENQRNGFAHGEDVFSSMQVKSFKMDGTIAASENFVKNETGSDRESEKSSLLSGKTSPDTCDSETAKDSGTEKKEEKKAEVVEEYSLELEQEHEEFGFDANSYQAETVDFPESPQHLKLLKQRTREAQGLGPDDDELTWSENRKGSVQSADEQHSRRERPSSFSAVRKKKISVHPDILASDNNDDDQRSFSSISNKSDADVMSPVDDFTPDDIDTPDDLDDSVLEYTASELIPELSAAEEMYDERSWRTCTVGGEERKIDVKVIEPYRKVLSHGGYYGPNKNAIIVFSACYLADRSRRDYDYVMDNLFLYVLSTLDQLIAEDYVLVYLHGATQRSNMPSFGWLKRCYQMIDRRLRKNLKGLYLVHPTFWVKTIVIMTKPFISSKFSRKLQFVNNLKELSDLIPMDDVCIPDKVKQFDEEKALEA